MQGQSRTKDSTKRMTIKIAIILEFSSISWLPFSQKTLKSWKMFQMDQRKAKKLTSVSIDVIFLPVLEHFKIANLLYLKVQFCALLPSGQNEFNFYPDIRGMIPGQDHFVFLFDHDIGSPNRYPSTLFDDPFQNMRAYANRWKYMWYWMNKVEIILSKNSKIDMFYCSIQYDSYYMNYNI